MGKVCSACGETKPLEAFHRHPLRKDGRHARCKACAHAALRASRRDPARQATFAVYQWRSLIKRLYGLTEAAYMAISARQDHGCAICGGKDADRRLAVDHCHDTGKIRGLLCANCNNGLGRFGENPAMLRRAADYLEEADGRTQSVPDAA